MAYINFALLTEKGYSNDHYLALVMIGQNDSLLLESSDYGRFFDSFEEAGLIQYLKTEKNKYKAVRLSDRGKAFLHQLTMFGYTDNIGKLANRLREMYREHGVAEDRLGQHQTLIDRIIWFISETPFNLSDIFYGIEEYLSQTNSEYVRTLDRLFWQPKDIYASKPTLKDSWLFERLCQKHEISVTTFIKEISKGLREFRWLSGVVNNPIPKGFPEEMYFTGSYKGDVTAKERIRNYLLNKYRELYTK